MTDDNSSGKPEDEDERPPAAWIPDEVGSQGDDEPVERAHRQRPYRFVGPIIPPIRVPFLDGLFKQQQNLFRSFVPNPVADLIRRVQPRIVTEIVRPRFTAAVVPPVVDLTAQLQKQLSMFDWPQVMPAPLIPRAQLDLIRPIQANLSALLPKIDLTPLIEAFRRNGPPNWEGLDDDVLLGTLFEIAEGGIPTAWVPRAAVLEALVDITEVDRPAVLVDYSAEVLEDCERLCDQIAAVDLQEQVVLLHEALQVAEIGHLAAAQALAVSIFDTVLRRTFKPKKIAGYYKAVKDAIEDHRETAPLGEMRWGLVHAPALIVLETFVPGDPIPVEFNRHASVHAAGAVQYHAANALIALMLATSLLREAQEEVAAQAANPLLQPEASAGRPTP